MNNEMLRYGDSGASHRLLLLHGWGADADDLIPFGHQLINNLPLSFELIALRAPQPHPQGIGRQWYGLFPADWPAVPNAVAELSMRVESIATVEIPLKKTILLGFSQGGAMALATGCELPLLGLIGCSSYPHPGWDPPLERPPVLLLHGVKDDVVPFSASKHLLTCLQTSNEEVELLQFEGGHGIPTELTPSIQKTLNKWIS